MNCQISNSFSFTNLKISAQSASVQYATVVVNQSIRDHRIWNFKLNAIASSNKGSIKFTFQSCQLPGAVKLSGVRFNGEFSGSLSMGRHNIHLTGTKTGALSYNWNVKNFEFTIFFHLPEARGMFYADLVLKDCDIFTKSCWESIINGSCTTFAKVFTNAGSSLACTEALAECEGICIGIGGGPEDPFADVICSASCGSLEVACEEAVDEGGDLSAQALCSDAGL